MMAKRQFSEQETRKQLGREIREARMRLGITQSELAERMSSLLDSVIGTTTVSKIESGSRSLSFAEAQAAGQILMLSLDELGQVFLPDRSDRIIDLVKLQLSNILSGIEMIQSSTHIIDELCVHLIDMQPRDHKQKLQFLSIRSYGHDSYDTFVDRDSEFSRFVVSTKIMAEELGVEPKESSPKHRNLKDPEQ